MSDPIIEALSLRRRELSFSRAIIAREVGVAKRTVASWEGGERSPTLGHLKKWAKILGRELSVRATRRPPIESVLRTNSE